MTDETDPIVQAAAWATQTVSGKPPVYAGVPGATDGTFLWSMKNIPIVTMGAGGYSTADFMRAGGIMTILFLVVMLAVVNVVF